MGRGGQGPSRHSGSSSGNSIGRYNSSTPRHSTSSHSSLSRTDVTITYSEPDPDLGNSTATEIDMAREAAYNALGDLITLTTTSRDDYSERITDVNSSVVTALAGYIDNSPIVSAISDDLSVWLNQDTQSKIDTYDGAISGCVDAQGWV